MQLRTVARWPLAIGGGLVGGALAAVIIHELVTFAPGRVPPSNSAFVANSRPAYWIPHGLHDPLTIGIVMALVAALAWGAWRSRHRSRRSQTLMVAAFSAAQIAVWAFNSTVLPLLALAAILWLALAWRWHATTLLALSLIHLVTVIGFVIPLQTGSLVWPVFVVLAGSAHAAAWALAGNRWPRRIGSAAAAGLLLVAAGYAVFDLVRDPGFPEALALAIFVAAFAGLVTVVWVRERDERGLVHGSSQSTPF